MCLQIPDSPRPAWHPQTPRFPSFCTTVSRLILASSVSADGELRAHRWPWANGKQVTIHKLKTPPRGASYTRLPPQYHSIHPPSTKTWKHHRTERRPATHVFKKLFWRKKKKNDDVIQQMFFTEQKLNVSLWNEKRFVSLSGGFRAGERHRQGMFAANSVVIILKEGKIETWIRSYFCFIRPRWAIEDFRFNLLHTSIHPPRVSMEIHLIKAEIFPHFTHLPFYYRL